ncbi:hypothetical protein EPA93_00770 [Ktedonosporobacter rubrisoli]|uniref:HTH cro/C1-type domain-containing protein n=1 Tax=Ktedonosporobacter rubrisoli TaxID=2509675 RepID=A0A4V0YY11_KTERU|nr:hypothetical protein [Ktedonosporobacter rubrisoli]QBD74601.1 hypothetical protein EPA93_00770 [Ktedonosporobacter rubrisoli]
MKKKSEDGANEPKKQVAGRYPNRLEAYIKELGFRKGEIAHLVGVSENMLTHYVKGRYPVPHQIRQRFAEHLEVEVEELFPRSNRAELRRQEEQEPGELIIAGTQSGPPPLLAYEASENKEASVAIPLPDRELEQGLYERDSASLICQVPPISAQTHTACQKVEPVARRLFSAQGADRDEIDGANMLSYGGLTAYIITLVQQWKGPYALLHTFIDQELAQWPRTSATKLSRRYALMTITGLSLLAWTTGRQRRWGAESEFLAQCMAALVACWHLINDGEFSSVAIVSKRCLPLLEMTVKEDPLYRVTAAQLATQAYILLGLVATHQLLGPENLERRLACCKRAVEYARLAQDASLLCMALIHTGYTHYYLGQLEKMLSSYQEAALYLAFLPPILQSKLLAGLAHAQARNGEEQQSQTALRLARESLPEKSEPMPSFVAADCGIFSLILDEGKTHFVLGQHKAGKVANEHYQRSEDALAQLETLPTSLLVPERFRVEMLTQRATTALYRGDREAFGVYFEQSIRGANELGSHKRSQEVEDLYQIVSSAAHPWHTDAALRELKDLLAKR